MQNSPSDCEICATSYASAQHRSVVGQAHDARETAALAGSRNRTISCATRHYEPQYIVVGRVCTFCTKLSTLKIHNILWLSGWCKALYLGKPSRWHENVSAPMILRIIRKTTENRALAADNQGCVWIRQDGREG